MAIHEAGSLNAAAQVLLVAQPSLTRQLRRLERDLGFDLFIRSPRGLHLTPAGVAFLPVARRLIDQATRAEGTARALARGDVADLTVVSAPTTVADVIAPFMVRAGPAGMIGNVVEAIPEDVYSVVAAGDADFAVGTRIPPAEVTSEVIGQAFLWAQVPPTHPLAHRRALHIEDLVGHHPLLVMSPAHGVRRLFDSAAAREGLSYTPLVETGTAIVAQALAAAGRGVCVVSDDSRFDLVSLPIHTDEGALTITLFGVWDPIHHASERIQGVVSDLRAYVVELYG